MTEKSIGAFVLQKNLQFWKICCMVKTWEGLPSGL